VFWYPIVYLTCQCHSTDLAEESLVVCAHEDLSRVSAGKCVWAVQGDVLFAILNKRGHGKFGCSVTNSPTLQPKVYLESMIVSY